MLAALRVNCWLCASLHLDVRVGHWHRYPLPPPLRLLALSISRVALNLHSCHEYEAKIRKKESRKGGKVGNGDLCPWFCFSAFPGMRSTARVVLPSSYFMGVPGNVFRFKEAHAARDARPTNGSLVCLANIWLGCAQECHGKVSCDVTPEIQA